MVTKILPAVVPAHAMILLDYIGSIEAPQGYDTIYGNNQKKLPKPLTSMTIGDIVDAQPTWSKRYRSSACGRYQFMRATIQSICRECPDLRGDMVFTRQLQDRFGYYLLLRRGYDRFLSGGMSVAQFGLQLAQEWASFPVLAPVKGQTRMVDRGESFYAGDALNKSLIKPTEVEKILRKVLLAAEAANAPVKLVSDVAPASPPPSAASEQGEALSSYQGLARPKKLRKSGRFWTWLTTGGISLTTITEKLGAFQMDWKVQIAILAVVVAFAVYAILTMDRVREFLGLEPRGS